MDPDTLGRFKGQAKDIIECRAVIGELTTKLKKFHNHAQRIEDIEKQLKDPKPKPKRSHGARPNEGGGSAAEGTEAGWDPRCGVDMSKMSGHDARVNDELPYDQRSRTSQLSDVSDAKSSAFGDEAKSPSIIDGAFFPGG